jgi:membrane-associated phospholipid phosphatase
VTAFFFLLPALRLCAAGLLFFLLASAALCPRCRAGERQGLARETLAATGAVLSSPLRLNKESALWTGGVAAGTLLAYSYDGQVRHLFSKNKSSLNDSFASVFEKAGDGSYGAGLLAVYGGLCYLLDHKEGPRTAALGAQAFIAANAAGTLIKVSAGRARPYKDDGKGIFRPFKLKTAYTSFTSGHTTSAFAIASVFARRCASPWVGLTAYGLAAGTALERVYDDKHWASDVVAGAALGTVVGRWIASPSRNKDAALLLPVYTPSYSGAALTYAF